MQTPLELKTEIQTGPLSSELAPHVTAGNTQAIRRSHADILNRQRTVMAELGPDVGASILDKLEVVSSTVSAVKWAMYGIKSDSGIDVGHPATRSKIDALVASGVLTAAEGAQLKSLAERPGSRAEILWGVGFEQVAEALRS